MSVLEHWPAIFSAVMVGAIAFFLRYTFVLKRDCNVLRRQCQDGTCKKIAGLKNDSTDKTDVLTSGARDTVLVLDNIRHEMSVMRVDIGALRAGFEQFLSDLKKNNK